MSEPKRTTKETHPHLPPGLILDKDGKVCKVCNSWQDFAGIKVYKKDFNPNAASGSSSSGSSGSGSGSGSGSKAGASGMAAMMAAMASSGSGSSSNTSSSTSGTSASTPVAKDRSECPPDTVELGRSTWTFLHTTAAYYPDKPSAAQKTHMTNLLSSLPSLYPCTWCADDFGESIKANPPQPAVESATKLNEWLCRRHNEVNKKLGKPEFQCDWKNIMRRWKDGPEDGSCD